MILCYETCNWGENLHRINYFYVLKRESGIFTPVFSAWNGDSGAKSLVIRFQ